MLAEYVKKHPDQTLAEMKQNLGFGINSIWYRLKNHKKKKTTLVPGTKKSVAMIEKYSIFFCR